MHNHLWGKHHGLDNPYPLTAHLLDTAAFATVLWDHWLRQGLKDKITSELGADARAYVAAAAGLHDIGKANPCFQGQEAVRASAVEPWMAQVRQSLVDHGLELSLSPAVADGMRVHQMASAAHLTNTVPDKPGRYLGLGSHEKINSDWLSATALGHHGAFKLPTSTQMEAMLSDRPTWKPVRDDITDSVLRAVGLTPGKAWPAATPISTILISGLVIIADRLASDLFSVVKPAQQLMAKKRLDPANGKQWIATRYDAFLSILKRRLGIYQPMSDVNLQVLGGHTPRGVQTEVSQAGDGLWMVMAPTGAGKTEAAMLRHGTSDERLIFCLPTMATTNAMANRVAKMFQATPNVGALEHSMRDLFDVRELGRGAPSDTSGLLPSDFLSQGANRLLGPVSIGTIDQVLIGSLRSKFTHLRLLSIANAHIVIDEAHLMDQYQTHLAEALFQWWGATGTKVTVLTATLPTWQRDKLKNAYYPPAPDAEPLPQVKFPSHETNHGAFDVTPSRYLIELEKSNDITGQVAHVQWVKKMRGLYPDSRLGVIVNTVKQAQAVASALEAIGEDVVLLHSRMTAKHRNMMASTLERKAGKNRRGKRFVVVGTQVVEASLDIDLDAISTDAAPASSLIQRAGRVWRHYDPLSRSRRVPGLRNLSMHVVFGNSPLPYFSTEIARVEKHLEHRNFLVMPDDSQAFVEASAFDIFSAGNEEFLERIDRRLALQSANAVRAPIDRLVQPKATYSDLSDLTDNKDFEAYTRLVKPPTASLILMAPASAGIPGSWTKSRAELEAIGNRTAADRAAAGKALHALVPVNGAIAGYVLRELDLPFDPKSPVLRRKIPVEIGNGRLRYHPRYGLYLVDPV